MTALLLNIGCCGKNKNKIHPQSEVVSLVTRV